MKKGRGPSDSSSVFCLWVEASTQAACLLGTSLARETGKGFVVESAGEGRWRLRLSLETERIPHRLLSRIRDQARRLMVHLGPIDMGWEPWSKEEKKVKVEKRFFREFAVPPSLKVVPLGRGGSSGEEGGVLELDPGKDFNCGLEPWTRIALIALEEVAGSERVESALDAKAGSGIMALSAAILGVERVVALDTNPQAVRLIRKNAKRNRLADRVKAKCAELKEEGRAYPLVMALESHKFLLREKDSLSRRVIPGGILLLGGFWHKWTQKIVEGLEDEFQVLESKRTLWWEALVLRKRK